MKRRQKGFELGQTTTSEVAQPTSFPSFSCCKEKCLGTSLNYNTMLKILILRFGRHRVIIRKGHVGRRFYIIYSGTVAFTLSEDDCEVFSKPTQYYHLGKGDAFGVRTSGFNLFRTKTC